MPIFQASGGTPWKPSFFEQLVQLGVPERVMQAFERSEALKLKREEAAREENREADRLLLEAVRSANELALKIEDPERRAQAIGTYASVLASGIGGERGAKIASEVAKMGGKTAVDSVNEQLRSLGLRKFEAETKAGESALRVAEGTEKARIEAAGLANEATKQGTAQSAAVTEKIKLETETERALAPLQRSRLEAEIRLADAQAYRQRTEGALAALASEQAKNPGNAPPGPEHIRAAQQVRENSIYTINSMMQALLRSGKTESDNDALSAIMARLAPSASDPGSIDRALGEAKQYVSTQTYAEVEAAITKAKLDLAAADNVIARGLGINLSALTPDQPGVAAATDQGIAVKATSGSGLNPTGKGYTPPPEQAPPSQAAPQPQGGQPLDVSAVGGRYNGDSTVTIPEHGFSAPPPDGSLEAGKFYYSNGIVRFVGPDGRTYRVPAMTDPSGGKKFDPRRAIVLQ